ncbi:MAG: HEAT repeat domain-containing protein [Planctomycetota bacterium]
MSERPAVASEAPSRELLPRIVLVVVLMVLGIALVVFFPGGTQPELSKVPEVYAWMNGLSLTPYPASAEVRRGGDDRIGRFLDRLSWGHSDVQNWTVRHLVQMGPAVADRAIERLPEALRLQPFYARELLRLLGKVARPQHLEALEGALHHDFDFVRMAAVEALAGIDSPEALKRLEALTRSPDAALQEQAYAALRNKGLLETEYALAFLEEMQADCVAGKPSDGVLRALRALLPRPSSDGAAVVEGYLVAPDAMVRLQAARTLLAMGDPNSRGQAELESQLRAPEEGEEGRVRALAMLTEAGTLVPYEVLEPLAETDSVATATSLAQLLGAVLPGLPPSDDRVARGKRLLRRLAESSRPRVRLEALVALHRAGEAQVAQPFLDKIGTVCGSELRETVQILAERLEDPRGITAMRARLAQPSLDPLDRSHLLHGLAVYHDGEAVPEFIHDLLAAGTPEDPRTDRIKLSFWAAVKIQGLGVPAARALIDLLETLPRREVALLALDALRKLLSPLAPADRERAVALLESLAVAGTLPDDVRVGAVESFPFLDDLSLTPRLLDLSSRLDNPTVSSALGKVLANYF